MEIIKRNGTKESLKLEKIVTRIKKMCYGLNMDYVDYNQVAITVFNGLYDGATTKQIDELASEASASKTTIHPDYSLLASRIAVSSLHKETSKSFYQTMKKLNEDREYDENGNEIEGGLINDEFLSIVSKHRQILDSNIIHDRDYGYDYFAFKTLQGAYLMKDRKGNILERPQYMLMRVAVALWGDNIDMVIKVYNEMSTKMYTHATPTLFNAGTQRQQMSSCFLLTMGDSIKSIYKTLSDTASISQLAGGIGICASNIRPAGSKIRGTNGKSYGIVPMLRVFNDTARYVDQGGGKRKGSFAIYLEPWHGDVFEFIDLRKTHGKEEMRARDLFLAIWSNDLFMKRVQENGDWYLMNPDECRGLVDAYGEEFEKLYLSYVEQGKYLRKVQARDLYTKICEAQIETGMPYITHKDSVNEKSNQKNVGTIKSSNLCVAPETKILTKDGYITIGENEGKEVQVWNGQQWSKTTIQKTGENQKLAEITFSNNKTIRCTLYHKFYLDINGNERELTASEMFVSSFPLVLFPWKSPNGELNENIRVVDIKILDETSDTYCVNEPIEHKAVFNGVLTGNCNEIVEYTSEDEHAVCNLASISLPHFVKNFTIDYKGLEETAYQVTLNLNRVIDINFYPTPETRKSNFRHRPVACGVQGLADMFVLLGVPFDSPEAKDYNKKVFETIYHGCLRASNDLAKLDGSYETFEGSPTSQGILQFDMWTSNKVGTEDGIMKILEKNPVELSGMWDFNLLKENIKKYGLRNSLLCAKMPTASSSQILGNNECFEPFTSLIYSRRTLHGEFVIVNKHLVDTLIKYNLWNDKMRYKIISNDGSIQSIEEIPQFIRDMFKTVWEIKQRDIIDMSADRGAFIDQTQSMNLFYDNVNVAKVSSAIMYGWLKGLKTGVYYTRTKSIATANSSLGIDKTKFEEPQSGVACSLDNPDACVACSA